MSRYYTGSPPPTNAQPGDTWGAEHQLELDRYEKSKWDAKIEELDEHSERYDHP